LYWDKNNKHKAVFQPYPTEINDLVIDILKTYTFEISDEGKNG
jgi:hypothetical protein